MWEKISFFVPFLSEYFHKSSPFLKWLLKYKKEGKIKIQLYKEEGIVLVTYLIKPSVNIYIVYKILDDEVAFYNIASDRLKEVALAKGILEEQQLSYEVREMKFYVKSFKDTNLS